MIAHLAQMDPAQWIALLGAGEKAARRWIVLMGVNTSDERARYLDLGFGDVLPDDAGLGEVEARAVRVMTQAECLPVQRTVGPLRLDLMARDGFVDDRPLGLHPREFALVWRLAETPRMAISKQRLLADVWRVRHVPDTNSLAVHVFRLRSKLAVAGLSQIVETDPSGSYRLIPPAFQAAQAASDLSGALAESAINVH